MSRQFVFVTQENHPLFGCACEVVQTSESGLCQLRAIGTSFGAWLKPDEFTSIQRGTKVTIEVTISDFYDEAMMVPGGWMSLSRIKAIVS